MADDNIFFMLTAPNIFVYSIIKNLLVYSIIHRCTCRYPSITHRFIIYKGSN